MSLKKRPKVKLKPVNQLKLTGITTQYNRNLKKISVFTLLNFLLFLTASVHAMSMEESETEILQNVTDTKASLPSMPIKQKHLRCDEAKIKCALRSGCSTALRVRLMS